LQNHEDSEEVSDGPSMLRLFIKVIPLLGPEIGGEDIVEESAEELAQGKPSAFAQNLLVIVFVRPLCQVLAQEYRGIGNGSSLNISGITALIS
jgi:hypothetical protein